ncbi:Killer cell lectin-like receptor subfamily B member 1 [Galemys pyrenaicus]|uniref:Killer cell lectin-like receptor subfamily B member 1 n=1 Tax=Galemys pyrenaicus TaxID=202257 RepID=A0A8J5ZTG1_GALPY|nr:Killer cell lectin-like receptor subfamily B member 1 [Galemys pyrenaicus]
MMSFTDKEKQRLLHIRDDLCVMTCARVMSCGRWKQTEISYIVSFLIAERPGLLKCPQDWTLVGERCLVFISSSSKSWSHSAADCSARESSLLLLQDQEKLKLIQNSISDRGNNFWIGLNSTPSEKKWKWINGSFLNPDM